MKVVIDEANVLFVPDCIPVSPWLWSDSFRQQGTTKRLSLGQVESTAASSISIARRCRLLAVCFAKRAVSTVSPTVAKEMSGYIQMAEKAANGEESSVKTLSTAKFDVVRFSASHLNPIDWRIACAWLSIAGTLDPDVRISDGLTVSACQAVNAVSQEIVERAMIELVQNALDNLGLDELRVTPKLPGVLSPGIMSTIDRTGRNDDLAMRAVRMAAVAGECTDQSRLHSLFLPVPDFDPAWVTPTTQRLAAQLYQGNSSVGPYLADALSDAGYVGFWVPLLQSGWPIPKGAMLIDVLRGVD